MNYLLLTQQEASELHELQAGKTIKIQPIKLSNGDYCVDSLLVNQSHYDYLNTFFERVTTYVEYSEIEPLMIKPIQE